MTGRRIASIWFPQFAMERWRRIAVQTRKPPAADQPLGLSADGPHGPILHALNEAAQARGVTLGARVVDMQAIHPDLSVEPADLEGDARALEALSFWARRWCPWSRVDGPDALLLDVSGATHLLGGEAGTLQDMQARFAMLGLTLRAAIAPNAASAWALSHYAPAPLTLCKGQDLEQQIAPLPVRALRLDAKTDLLLNRLGLKTIGQLAALPRETLTRRFARHAPENNPLTRLDLAQGRSTEPLNSPEETPRFLTRARLAEPVIDPLPHLPDLCERLCTALKRQGRGARMIRLTVYRTDGEWRSAEVATAEASRDPAHLGRLLDGKLDRIDPGFGFDAITLEALRTEPVAQVQRSLEGRSDPEQDVNLLLDRLTARLGPQAVTWSQHRESHLPERMEAWETALRAKPSNAPPPPKDRPIRLLDPAEEVRVVYAVPEGPPAQFIWRRVTYKVTRKEGPERIAPEWWHDKPGSRLRDYYKVEVAGGQRFWIYRQGVMGDGRGDDPRWFLHGFFA